jgi:glucose-6-phosphate isomerase
MKPQITFDYTSALSSAVAFEGVDQLDVKAGVGAVRTFRKRVGSGHIGFPDLPNDRSTLESVVEFAERLRPAIDSVLVLGIGGSALGAYAIDCALRGPHPFQLNQVAGNTRPGTPMLVVLDNIDPGVVAAAIEKLHPRRTAVCVIAKSGSTAETMATFLIVHEWLQSGLGRRAREHIIAITDPQQGDLLAIAKQERYPLFFVPRNVGGRFSVLSPVGLVPAALAGFDVRKLLRGAADANEACWSDSIEVNPALSSALVHHALDTTKGKSIEVVFAYSSYLWGTAFWYRQLWAESIGKEIDRKGRKVEAGQTPIAALGVTDQHSQLQLYIEGPRDKMITFWAVERDRAEVRIPRSFSEYDSCRYLGGKKLSELFQAERVATEAALTRAARPNCRWTLPRVDEYTLGAFFQILEFQTAFAGELYNLDAFDQPGVELGKRLTYGLMGRKGFEQYARGLRTSDQG